MAAGAQQWLTEGLAEWASVRANAAAGGLEQNPDRTMDCVGSECGDSEFDRNGNLAASTSAPTHNIYIYGGDFTLRADTLSITGPDGKTVKFAKAK